MNCRKRNKAVRIAAGAAMALMILLLGGSMVFAKGPEKNTGSAEEIISVSEISENAGFTVQVDPNGLLPVKDVTVEVWCAEDKSDLDSYAASREEDGTFSAEVRVSRHGNHLGNYQIEAYGTLENGSRWFLGRISQYFSPSNFVVVRKTDDIGGREITLNNVNPWAEGVMIAVWSLEGEQDDLVWNEAFKNEDGTWSCTLSVRDYLHDGKFRAEAYVDGVRAGTRQFSADISEMGRNGWYYENGLRLFYVNDRLQTDVRDLVGGPYQIEVNRTCNVITIYSAQDEGAYITPVVSFLCSVGLPDTPTPTGLFYTGTKYRWKTLMGPSYGQYVTHVYAGVYFHSVAGDNMTSYNLDPNAYNMLGSPASHGCIRMCVRDAKWMYENVPSGTPVYIYDSESTGPFPKPELPKIPPEQNWDPTDPEIQ